ncbi:hypothetical protein BGX33_011437 [Mortierella sp. NVP41]|nr:hypothetical protein BGX33_011437 [Mortierella sp. NVP41]
MSLQVNFTTHGHDLKATYESILQPADPKNSNNWAMFGYDKGTNDLKVLGQGDGGLEELEDEFMDGKIQYAFVRIIDPNTELNKFILIAWCGDGVPESKKGLFNSHLVDGYHLQINARCEADVTPAQILKRVNEGSGSKYSIHKETYEQEKIRPLQSAYKKTEIPDISAMQRNPTKPEPAPKFGGARSFVSSTPLPSTTTTTSPVTRSWNAPVVNTPPPVTATKPVERTWKTSGSSSYTGSTGATFNKVAPPSSLLNYGITPSSTTTTSTRNDPAMNKAQQMRLEREAREKEERERIKREIEASEARDRQDQGQSNTFKEAEEKRLQEEQRRREQEERQRSQNRVREEREAREREERARADAEDSARSAREAMKAREQAAHEEEQKRQKEQQQRQREKEEKDAAEKRLKQQREEEEMEEEKERAAQTAAAAVAATAAVAAGAAVVASQVSHAGHEEAAPDSVSAVVLYSYEQAEENEMSLIEGEVIFNVTELDVGWWSGESADGTRSGLFPANYVEVIESTQEHAAAAPAAAHYEEEEHDAHHEDIHQTATNEHAYAEAAAPAGPSAVALYDYTAGEPNELSFAEGDVIIDIEFVTDDWWNGSTQNGSAGLFPCQNVQQEGEHNSGQKEGSGQDGEDTTMRDEATTDPWRHLWPPPRPPPPDEYYCGDTPALSRTTSSSGAAAEATADPEQQQQDDLSSSSSCFRPDLWSRIQIRYAPTVRHLQSLFRCLHLSSKSTHGKTFGPGPGTGTCTGTGTGNDGDNYGDGGGSATATATRTMRGLPSLVILLGCFGHDRSLEIRRFSMTDVVPRFADLRTFDEADYVAEDDMVRGPLGSRRDDDDEVGEDEEEDEEEEEDLDGEELEELEYAEYIQMVGNTMAEIKDSLAWLERISGRKPELLIVEDTTKDRTAPQQQQQLLLLLLQQQQSSMTSTTTMTRTRTNNREMMPTVRELWLQTVLGFWVDALFKTEQPPITLQQQQQQAWRDSYTMWVITQESLSAAFTTATTTATAAPPAWVEGDMSSTATAAAAAAAAADSIGAILGVRWHFDASGDRVHFDILP